MLQLLTWRCILKRLVMIIGFKYLKINVIRLPKRCQNVAVAAIWVVELGFLWVGIAV